MREPGLLVGEAPVGPESYLRAGIFLDRTGVELGPCQSLPTQRIDQSSEPAGGTVRYPCGAAKSTLPFPPTIHSN
ncbi:hypothetical protein C0Q70_12414 [Pomacea canaliculata]|uniref:Uncharacterized protein n=1 Tax=Pomacea canaliculata TaxID=400727 RepID=A0A2T7P1G1_POMCA|nr:hypothetical protein C0Q70_12414 [Pomacea canaliculata]